MIRSDKHGANRLCGHWESNCCSSTRGSEPAGVEDASSSDAGGWKFRESSVNHPRRLWAAIVGNSAVFSGPWRQGGPTATESKSNATCVRFSTERGVSSQLPVVPPLKKHALTSRAFFCWYPKVNRLQNSQIRVGGVVSALGTFRYRLRISKRFAKFRQSSKMEARTKLTDVALDGDPFLTQLSGLSGIQCPQISVWEVPQ